MPTPREASGRTRRAAWFLFTGTAAATLVAAAVVWSPDTASIEAAVSSAGPIGPALFVALYAVLTVLFVPGTVGSAAAGVLFGAALGSILVVTGATLGATLSFLVARRLGREAVARRLGPRATRLDGWLGDHGLPAVIYVRLIPLFPFNAVNYAAGVTGVSARDYVVGTAIGIVPGTVALVSLGSSISDPGSPRFLVALGAVVLLSLLGAVAARRHARTPAEPPS